MDETETDESSLPSEQEKDILVYSDLQWGRPAIISALCFVALSVLHQQWD